MITEKNFFIFALDFDSFLKRKVYFANNISTTIIETIWKTYRLSNTSTVSFSRLKIKS